VAVSPCGKFSLLRAHPLTGRTHQIRVHAAALGLPLVGDPLYGGQKEHEAFGEIVPRVCLHAETLAITHPVSNLPMTLTAPLPEDLVAMISLLGFSLNFEACRSALPQ
jgi:23S rRNA-/tRNA-specific pseudouridylate synthase